MVQLSTVEGEHHFGVVRYVGDMPGVAGTWAGVELAVVAIAVFLWLWAILSCVVAIAAFL